MSLPEFSKWAPMSTAPRDGTLVLVAIHASEQGPAEVDAVVPGNATFPVTLADRAAHDG